MRALLRLSLSTPWLRAAAAVLLLALCAAPLAAYTIWLKDGTTIIARSKYEVKNGKAIITLLNGEQSFIDAAQIDAAKTEAANHGRDYNTTDLGNTRVVPGEAPPPAPNRSLSDLVAAHRPSTRNLPTSKRASETSPGQQLRSKGGYLDLASLQHVPYARTEITTDVQQFFRSQGIDEVEVWNGSQPDRMLIEVTTASEASVFQSLTAGANALLRVRDRFPQAVAVFEMVMKTPAREKAGQFVLTPDAAAALVAKKIEPPAFFVANVQF
ncbi:MAG: hypothetical protein JOZ15_11690 [Acidobacteria bacterium]|nr:hypothetical protein [Acidobacteriota bacterium]